MLTSPAGEDDPGPGLRARLAELWPWLVLAPSLVASFVYVFVFTGWTFYISLSDSSLLPSYRFVGLDNYIALWSNRRWNIAYTNLFFFSVFYVTGTMAVGLLLAILIDQRIRAEALFRTIFLYPLAVSFVVTGTVWSWLYDPTAGIEQLVRGVGFERFAFAPATHRDTAIWTIVATGIWQASGFAIKTFNLIVALSRGGLGIATTFPAIYVYDLMFQRGQIGQGAAAAIMMLLALTVVLVPYALWLVWRRRREAGHG